MKPACAIYLQYASNCANVSAWTSVGVHLKLLLQCCCLFLSVFPFMLKNGILRRFGKFTIGSNTHRPGRCLRFIGLRHHTSWHLSKTVDLCLLLLSAVLWTMAALLCAPAPIFILSQGHPPGQLWPSEAEKGEKKKKRKVSAVSARVPSDGSLKGGGGTGRVQRRVWSTKAASISAAAAVDSTQASPPAAWPQSSPGGGAVRGIESGLRAGWRRKGGKQEPRCDRTCHWLRRRLWNHPRGGEEERNLHVERMTLLGRLLKWQQWAGVGLHGTEKLPPNDSACGCAWRVCVFCLWSSAHPSFCRSPQFSWAEKCFAD